MKIRGERWHTRSTKERILPPIHSFFPAVLVTIGFFLHKRLSSSRPTKALLNSKSRLISMSLRIVVYACFPRALDWARFEGSRPESGLVVSLPRDFVFRRVCM